MAEKEGGDQKKNKGDGGKKEEGPITVVLEVDVNCKECAKDVKKDVARFPGVETVNVDISNKKLTVTVLGKVDPVKIRQGIEFKTKKKVDLVSPLPKDEEEKKAKKPKEKEGGDQKKNKGDGGKKEEGPITVVLEVDVDCEECAKNVKKDVARFPGVRDVNVDISNKKLTVTVVGKVDPEEVREWIKFKTKKKVDLVSPLPKKAEKPKEPGVSTVVLKIKLHGEAEDCIRKITKIISNSEGVEHVEVDWHKLKRAKEIVQPKEADGGRDKKGKGGGGDDEMKNKKGGRGGGGGRKEGCTGATTKS